MYAVSHSKAFALYDATYWPFAVYTVNNGKVRKAIKNGPVWNYYIKKGDELMLLHKRLPHLKRKDSALYFDITKSLLER